MSWQATRWARDQRTGSAAAKVVLMVLAEQAGEDGRCLASVSTVGDRSELKRSATLKHLAALDADGLIVRTRRNDQFGHRTTDEIRFPNLAPQNEPRGAPKVHETNLGEIPRSTKQGAKVHETGLLGPPDGPHRVVSEKKIIGRKAKPSPRTATPIEDGFPDQGAIDRERSFLQQQGWNIDAGLEAEKFRSHALDKGRTGRDWNAGFHGWIVKAIQFAQPSARIAPVVAAVAVPGPTPWRSRVKAFSDPKNGHWNDTDWGPRPGKPGCVMPPQIAAEFGFGPVNVVPLNRAGAA